jgi:hypothetical protein
MRACILMIPPHQAGISPLKCSPDPQYSDHDSDFRFSAPSRNYTLYVGKGWVCECTRSRVRCLGPVCGLRSAEDERLGTRWCTEPEAQSRMHFIPQTPFLEPI